MFVLYSEYSENLERNGENGDRGERKSNTNEPLFLFFLLQPVAAMLQFVASNNITVKIDRACLHTRDIVCMFGVCVG